MQSKHVFALLLAATAVLTAAGPAEQAEAESLYQRTEYREALKVAERVQARGGAWWELTGRCRFMLGEYKPAVEAFEKAVQLEPKASDHYLWLGRAWGRRAEAAMFLVAPKYATTAHENFERAVQLDPSNKDATGDLLDYYLDAPGFLGGGVERAEKLCETIQRQDPAEYEWAKAQVEIHRKQFDQAESHLRKAAELAPKQVNRIVDLAKFLAARGRVSESEAAFEQAAKINPRDKRLLYGRAESYVKHGGNPEVAKKLLEAYLQCALTPDDPSREDARKLLAQAQAKSRGGAGN